MQTTRCVCIHRVAPWDVGWGVGWEDGKERGLAPAVAVRLIKSVFHPIAVRRRAKRCINRRPRVDAGT